jgi:hypothetical protein
MAASSILDRFAHIALRSLAGRVYMASAGSTARSG